MTYYDIHETFDLSLIKQNVYQKQQNYKILKKQLKRLLGRNRSNNIRKKYQTKNINNWALQRKRT